MSKDLNKLKRRRTNVECNGKSVSNRWKSEVVSENVEFVSLHFDGIGDSLIDYIQYYGRRNGTLLACVAWLSDGALIDSIKKYCKRTLIVVNDENFKKWGNGNVTKKYEGLPRFEEPLHSAFGHLKTLISCLDLGSKTCSYAPVRKFDCGSKTNFRYRSLMHAKYWIFFESDPEGRDVPVSFWMGSNNGTNQSKRNIESGIFVKDRRLSMALFQDFVLNFMCSKPLSEDPVDVEGRFGTHNPCIEDKRRERW